MAQATCGLILPNAAASPSPRIGYNVDTGSRDPGTGCAAGDPSYLGRRRAALPGKVGIMSSESFDHEQEVLADLQSEWEKYLRVFVGRKYSSADREPYEEVHGPDRPGDAHPLWEAVEEVQYVCFDKDPLPSPYNDIWGDFLDYTQEEELSRDRDRRIRECGFQLLKWVKAELARLKGPDKGSSDNGVQAKAMTEAQLKNQDPDELFSHVSLADRLGLSPDDSKARDRVRKRLEAWRKANPGGNWGELTEAKPRQPKYLFPFGEAWKAIQDIRPSV